jgi:hypothetical protein
MGRVEWSCGVVVWVVVRVVVRGRRVLVEGRAAPDAGDQRGKSDTAVWPARTVVHKFRERGANAPAPPPRDSRRGGADVYRAHEHPADVADSPVRGHP